jgi:hypothetical protein
MATSEFFPHPPKVGHRLIGQATIMWLKSTLFVVFVAHCGDTGW